MSFGTVFLRRHPGLLLAPAVGYLLLLLVAPATIFFVYSFWRPQEYSMVPDFTLANYARVFVSETYRVLLFRSLLIAAAAGLLSILLAFPVAYAIAFRAGRFRDLLLFVVMLSLFTSYLVRIYAWRSILSTNGLVDTLMTDSGLSTEHQSYLLFSPFGTLIALVNVYVPLAVLPIYAALLNVPRVLLAASRDLGATGRQTFWRVTLPLTSTGVIAAFTFVFLLSAGDYVTPTLVGGTDGAMIAGSIQTQIGDNFNWPVGSALAYSLTVVLAAVLVVAGLALRRIGVLRRI
jgi:spermidine/putrescine transport system permease protein